MKQRAILGTLAAGLMLGGGVASSQTQGFEPPAPPAQRVQASSPKLTTDPGDLEAIIKRFDQAQAEVQDEIDTIDPDLDITEKRITARGRRYYKFVRAGLLPAGGGFDALVDHATEMERLRMALLRDLDKKKALTRRKNDLTAQLSALKSERGPYDLHREAVGKATRVLRQAEERKAAFERAFESSNLPPDYVTVYGADLGPDVDDSAGVFGQKRGRLPLPIVGRAEVRKVMREGGAGPGLELTAPSGARARSVAAGRVAFADRLDSYGMTILIDHGEHYYSLYSNLDNISVEVGDVIFAGQELASVFSTTGKCLLYFELRQGQQLLDPSPWLGLG